MGDRQRGRNRHSIDQASQTLIEVGHARQIMKHPLVDAQRARCQRLSVAHVNKAPAAQR